MTSYKQRIAMVAPPTLQKQIEVLAAARTLLGQEHEAARRRRDEIAALRREYGELVLLVQELWRQYDSRLRSHVIRDDTDRSSASKASPGDPKHPGWPAGTPDGRGGKFRPKDGEAGAAETNAPLRYAAAGDLPPAPSGYDPKTWTQGRWWNNNKYFLKDPDGNVYTVHPEDERHWRHWDKRDGDNNDQGRWPPNSLKPREGQTRLRPDQSDSDPNGDAPPWTPKPDPLVPAVPIPMPLPAIPTPVPIEPFPIPELIPIPG